jgi:hypothetical protein
MTVTTAFSGATGGKLAKEREVTRFGQAVAGKTLDANLVGIGGIQEPRKVVLIVTTDIHDPNKQLSRMVCTWPARPTVDLDKDDEIIALLAERWPRCFMLAEDRRLPQRLLLPRALSPGGCGTIRLDNFGWRLNSGTINCIISTRLSWRILNPLLPDRGERASHPAGISAAGFCRRAPRLRSLWWISLILKSLTLDRKVTLRDSRRQRDEPSPAKVLADGSTREKHRGCNRQRPAACAHA